MLLHRRRSWSDTQRKWMGWERKRGKLHELNRLLRGATDTTFIDVGASGSVVPQDVRYVITLDADTRLPRETARRLIGKLSHPLNRPRLDDATRRVVEGYAVLQPRVTPSLPMNHEGSLFQRIVSSTPGLDPYAAAVSDVYQDLFGEGSYAGKGIYDVDAFEAALADRAADGTLLSHDLFEGIFARAGLVSDVEVVEEFPARYDVAAARQHRWARGDWQLLPWLLGRRDASRGDRRHRALPLIGAWKMLDNLRRTLSAPAGFLALTAGWTLPLHPALLWTGFVLVTIALPSLIPVAAAIVPRRAGITARSHARAFRKDLMLAARQIAFQIVFLPHLAWLMLDAIGRTLFRLFVSRRNLLQWVTADQASVSARPGIAGSYRKQIGGVVLTLLRLARRLLVARRCAVDRRAFRTALARCSSRRAVDQPRPADGKSPVGVRPGRACAAPGRASHVAVFRAVRHGRRSHASARQLPGGSARGAGPPYVTHQSRPVPAVDCQRPRSGLDRDTRRDGTAGSDARHDGEPAAFPRSLLQLV